jgi:hypothetical protein
MMNRLLKVCSAIFRLLPAALPDPECNRPVNQGILKNGESENSAFISGSESDFQVKYSARDMKQAVWRRMENEAGNVRDGVTL